MKKIILVLTLIVGVTLSSMGQTVTTFLFKSNVQEKLSYNGTSFSGSGEYFKGELTVETSPHNFVIKDSNGEVVFNETVIPADKQESDKWTIFGFYSANKSGMVITVLINNSSTIAETGDYGMVWITERSEYGTGSGVSLLLTDLVGAVQRELRKSFGLE